MFVSKKCILKKVAFGTAESLEIDAFLKNFLLKIEGIENNS